jgi:hypothetical protein
MNVADGTIKSPQKFGIHGKLIKSNSCFVYTENHKAQPTLAKSAVRPKIVTEQVIPAPPRCFK